MATKAEIYAQEFMQSLADAWATENIEDFQGPVELTDFLVPIVLPILTRQLSETADGEIEINNPAIFEIVSTTLTRLVTPLAERPDAAGSYTQGQIQQAQAAAEAAVADSILVEDNLTWDENGILEYTNDADQVREDDDSEASVTFVLNLDAEQPEPEEENAVNIQIANFTAGDVLDVSSFAGDLAVGDAPVVTGVVYDDGILGISMVASDPDEVEDLLDLSPAWNIEFSDIDPTLVDGLEDMGEGDLTAGLIAGLATDDFWLVL